MNSRVFTCMKFIILNFSRCSSFIKFIKRNRHQTFFSLMETHFICTVFFFFNKVNISFSLLNDDCFPYHTIHICWKSKDRVIYLTHHKIHIYLLTNISSRMDHMFAFHTWKTEWKRNELWKNQQTQRAEKIEVWRKNTQWHWAIQQKWIWREHMKYGLMVKYGKRRHKKSLRSFVESICNIFSLTMRMCYESA